MIYMEDATKKQLLQIALHEDCDIDYKYDAAAELQMRQWQEEFLPELLRLWGKGMSAFNIGIEMGIPESTVRSRLRKYDLYGRRVGHV